MAAKVHIYTTPTCPYCRLALALLRSKGVDFVEIDVAARPDLRIWLAEQSGQRTVPQVFVNGRSVGGFSDISALDRAGRLSSLLAAPPDPGQTPLPL